MISSCSTNDCEVAMYIPVKKINTAKLILCSLLAHNFSAVTCGKAYAPSMQDEQ